MNGQHFNPGWESLQAYTCPDWFRDAKFGIWNHWGPQSVAMVGDWYARNMYVEGHPNYLHHCRSYGHPSKFGYKDYVRLWKAEHFDPDRLLDLYKRVGAKYFYCCGVHCDNFDCWDSSHHRWNSVKVGPGQDIVGMFRDAAAKAGLRFGVTEHLARAWSWFNTNKGADRTGPHAGVRYDGDDPAHADFYFEPHSEISSCYPQTAPESWMRGWQARMIELIDRYDPDLFYTDGGVPFGRIGREVMAHFYNRNIERHGTLDGVYALKDAAHLTSCGFHGEYRNGIGVLDVERGVVPGIHPAPWQTDTCIGEWYYKTQAPYKTPAEIITMLVDIVSKNGNLLLNFPLRPDGILDEEEEWIAGEIGKWLDVNGEGIYGTRPHEVRGEGPTKLEAGLFAEKEKKTFTAGDFRFTTRPGAVYCFLMGWPANRELEIETLRQGAGPGVITGIELLGSGPVPAWGRRAHALLVTLPEKQPCDHTWGLKISHSV